MSAAKLSPLGKASTYVSQYQRDLLFPIPRKLQRDEIGVTAALPFQGLDTWNAYEISWLNAKGKPIAALGEFIFQCESPNLVESKSFKLYLNSFNNTKFNTLEDVIMILQRDLAEVSGAPVMVNLTQVEQFGQGVIQSFKGFCLDNLDVACDTYTVTPAFLKTEDTKEPVAETVYSNLLKSNCLVTGQPDWASVCIYYTGKKIQHEGLLKYIVSFRNHNEFHEQCVERMFVDIMHHCQPERLSIEARYTRRGGLDINPFRSTPGIALPANIRLARQ